MKIVPTPSSAYTAVTNTSAEFSTTMAADQYYVFCANTDAFIKQGTTPVASAADGSTFVAAGVSVLIDGGLGAKLAVVRDTADGKSTLTRVKAS